MHASLRSHGQSLRELHSLLVEHLPRRTNAALQSLVAQQDVNLHKQRCFAQASDRDRQAQRVPDPKAQDLESLSRGEGGGVMGGGGGSVRGSQGGGSPPADFSIPAGGFSGGFFWRFFPLHFATKKNPPQNPPQDPPLSGEFLFQKSPGLEAPEIHRPPPPPQGEKIQVLRVRVWDRHFSGWEFPGKDSRFNWTSEPRNPYRKNRCGMAMHGVPCSMSY